MWMVLRLVCVVFMADVLAPRRVRLWVYELWLDHVGVRDMQVYAVDPQPTQPSQSET